MYKHVQLLYKTKINPRQGITWLMGRWRPQQTARRHVNCRTHDHWHVERILRLVHLVLTFIIITCDCVWNCTRYIWLSVVISFNFNCKHIFIYLHNKMSSKHRSQERYLWLKFWMSVYVWIRIYAHILVCLSLSIHSDANFTIYTFVCA